jgi:hypothetical protein
MCKVKHCSRPAHADGLCGFHVLQGYYRTQAVPGLGLTATRVGRPRVHVVADDPPGGAPAEGRHR